MTDLTLESDSDEETAISSLGCEDHVSNFIIDATQSLLWTPLAIIWIILVIIVGAFFFFMLVGAIPMSSDELEKKWFNISIQALNVLFTYAAIANEPKRLRVLIRLFRVKGTVGLDHDGKTSNVIFDYVPWKHRVAIVVILNLNCIFQYINQGFRIKYHSDKLANEGLAPLWVNLFFFLSFFCAAWAPVYQWRAEQRVRREGRAPPGEELDPIQRFVGKEEYTYRELWNAGWAVAKEKMRKGNNKSDVSDETDVEPRSENREDSNVVSTGDVPPVPEESENRIVLGSQDEFTENV